jgi:hypothetical protein
MATISTSLNGGVVTVTGSGYSGTHVPLAVAFTATDGKRRYLELQAAPVSGGAINYPVPVPTSGSVTVKSVDPVTVAVLATTTQAV